MGSDPNIAFGLRLTKVALAAKAGMLTTRDRIELLTDVLAFFRQDDVVCNAVLAFSRDCQIDQHKAGADLLDFMETYCGDERFSRAAATEAALATIAREDMVIYDWQKRADCYG